MIQMAALIEQVRETMANVFGVDESELPAEVEQDSYAAWTSLQHMVLLASLEEQFGITFSMSEMATMTSLPRIIAVLGQHNLK